MSTNKKLYRTNGWDNIILSKKERYERNDQHHRLLPLPLAFPTLAPIAYT